MELQRGQKIKIQDILSGTEIQIKLTVKMQQGNLIVSCFGTDNISQLSDTQYFISNGQNFSKNKELSMGKEGNDIILTIDLQRLPPSVPKIIVAISTDECSDLSQIAAGHVSIMDHGQNTADYYFDKDSFGQGRAANLIELYQKTDIWRLSVVSGGFNGGLEALLTHFGAVPEKFLPLTICPPGNPLSSVAGSPPQPFSSPAPQTKINLKKSGDTHKINLSKNTGEIRVNLNWNQGFGQAIDLDLACLYRLKSGKKGIVQALGNAFGSTSMEPYILLDKDDRFGNSADGETMLFQKPDTIDFAVVFAYIYQGAPNWQQTGARVLLRQQSSPDIEIWIDNTNYKDRFCVIASLFGKDGNLDVRREERFFGGHREIDNFYGFGLRWTYGAK